MPPPTPPSVNDGRMIGREADLVHERERLGERARHAAVRHLDPDRGHRLAELQPVLGHLDRLERRADELDAEPLEHARLGQIDGEVERRLAADGRQQRVRPLALDDGGERRRR